mmetsp:Transcript_11366/g.40320  ORF Transcript_11366/g.40320 Transcript_11366/m.40320 type:complete len:603 (+) Transcript_11366:71-1879(+)
MPQCWHYEAQQCQSLSRSARNICQPSTSDHEAHLTRQPQLWPPTRLTESSFLYIFQSFCFRSLVWEPPSLRRLRCQERATSCRKSSACRRLTAAKIIGPRATQLREPLEGLAEVGLQGRLILGIDLQVLSEAFVPEQHHVRDQHHLVAGLADDRLSRLLVVALHHELARNARGWGEEQDPRGLAITWVNSLSQDRPLQIAVLSEGHLADTELFAGLRPSGTLARGYRSIKRRACNHNRSVPTRQRLGLQVAFSQEEILAARAHDGDPTTALRQAANGRAEGLDGNEREHLVLVESTDDRRVCLGLFTAIDPLRCTTIAAGRKLSGVRCTPCCLLPFLGHVLAQVNVLALPRSRSNFLGNGSSVRHLRVVLHRNPLIPDHVGSVLVAEDGRVFHPRTRIAGATGVATAVDMASGDQDNSLLVTEAHAAEHIPDVLSQILPTLQSPLVVQLEAIGKALLGAGQTTRGNGLLRDAINPASAERYLGTPGVLNGDASCHDPEVGVRKPWELGLDRLQVFLRFVQTRILGIPCFLCMPHGRPVGATSAVRLAVCAGRVPCQTDEQRSIAAVIPLGCVHDLFEAGPNLLVISARVQRRAKLIEGDAAR